MKNTFRRIPYLSRLQKLPGFLWGTLNEVARCFVLGFRDGLRPKIALISFTFGLLAALAWLIVFYVWRAEITFFTAILTGKIVFGYIHSLLPTPLKMMATTVPIPDPMTILSTLTGGVATTVLTVIFVVLEYILAVLVTMRIALELFFIGRVQKQCLKHYPDFALGVESTIKGNLRNMVGAWSVFVVTGLICLIIPVFGGWLFFLLCSYLNVRGLANDVLDGIATDAEIRTLITSNRVSMTVLGVIFTLFLFIPVIGLLAPGVMGAAVCHLCMKKLQVERSGNRLQYA